MRDLAIAAARRYRPIPVPTKEPPAAAGRAAANPLLVPADIPPSRPDFEVIGVFNPAVKVEDDGSVSLLVRVAERPRDIPPDEVAAPVFDSATARIAVRRWRRGAAGVRTDDPRVVVAGRDMYLTSISHLRWALSSDGLRFDVDGDPALSAASGLDAYGVEDARATHIDGEWWINYTAVSSWGIATAAAVIRDGRLERRGIWFPPPNRDVTPFPEKIAGGYAALHRPMPEGLGASAIWFASSPDLRAWGSHRPVAGPRPGAWDSMKIGGGAPPFRVPEGWLALYHGVDGDSRYCLGALLLDTREPWRVLGRSSDPVLAPEAPYERTGFFGNVVFTCGVAVSGDRVRVYYGAADTVVAAADLSIRAILAGLA
jgi:predicted GH43/DUF377 family glycosyl hydrolase